MPAAAQVQVFLASILYEWNDVDAAADQLEQALKASRMIGNRAIELDIHRIRAHIQQARGYFPSAQDILNELQQLTQGFDSPPARAIVAAPTPLSTTSTTRIPYRHLPSGKIS